MRRLLVTLLPFLGAAGFFAMSELSLRRPGEFFQWSLATVAWILLAFFALARGKMRGRLTWIAVPAVAMVSLSTVASLLFLDLLATRHGVIAFFAVVLYLFLEHVRRETASDDPEERFVIGEFARMINIGSLFLMAAVGLGIVVFLPFPSWWTVLAFAAVASLWSWHLFLACTRDCGRPLARVLVTVLVVVETFLVALRLPVSMFVGGALIGLVYYLAANLLPVGATETIPAKLIRKYAMFVGGLLLLLLLTARWV